MIFRQNQLGFAGNKLANINGLIENQLVHSYGSTFFFACLIAATLPPLPA
jgi:hypothetical protein